MNKTTQQSRPRRNRIKDTMETESKPNLYVTCGQCAELVTIINPRGEDPIAGDCPECGAVNVIEITIRRVRRTDGQPWESGK